jgi:hypothetical protein
MRTALAIALASLTFAACVPQNDDPHPVGRAIPTAEDVHIELPDGSSQKGVANAVGDLSPWYVVTRTVTRDLNGGTGWVLWVVHTIVQFPPTTVDGDTYTWGPWSDALDPAEYRLVVSDLGDETYAWTLDGRSKRDAAATFETVISGTAVAGETEGTGHGDFTIDFDAAERVNPIDNNARGVVGVVYDLAARHLEMAVSTVENRDGVDVPVDYDYSYTRAVDGSGDMVFASHGDTDDAGTLAEDAVIRSRWLSTGAGRADVRLSGGDLGTASVTASECWDTTFSVVYYSDSAGFLATEGDNASCAYTDVDLP